MRGESASGANRRTLLKHLLIVAGMFGFGYLMVPIYDVLCDITGLNGKTGVISESDSRQLQVDEQREVVVEFVSVINAGGQWEFRPAQARMTVHPGKLYTTSYYAKNLSDSTVVGQAVPSVAPTVASKYFNKTECFCFSRQVFPADGDKDMPLTFVIDPELPRSVETVTLSYTFFDTGEQPDEQQSRNSAASAPLAATDSGDG